MKIKLLKSVSLTDNVKSHYTRTITVKENGVEREVTQLVIPNAILSTTTQDVQGDILSESFLAKAFKKVQRILVNEEHQKNSDVGHVENLKIEKNKVFGDIVVQAEQAIDKVKSGVYTALSVEGFATLVKKYLNARVVEDGEVNAVALTSNPANKDAYFAKSDDESIPVAVITEVNEDYNLSKSDTSATPAPEASTDASNTATDTQTADDTQKAVEPADKQAEPAPGQVDVDVDTVDTQALQVEIIKDLEKQLKEAKEKLDEATTALAKSNEQAQLVKSADTAKKKLENENYILKMSVATIKKAEESYKSEIETLKKSLEEANAKVTALNDEIDKTPVASKISKSFAVVEDEVEDEFAKEYLVFDKNGNIDKQKTLAKALSMSVKNTKITD